MNVGTEHLLRFRNTLRTIHPLSRLREPMAKEIALLTALALAGCTVAPGLETAAGGSDSYLDYTGLDDELSGGTTQAIIMASICRAWNPSAANKLWMRIPYSSAV